MTATQIVGNLYIGDIQDVREGDTSRFDTIIGVCQDDCSDNVSCKYQHFNLADGPEDQIGHNPGEYSYELLEDAITAAFSARLRRETVLVHCHAGQSRSATVCIAALALLEGHSWEEAYNIVEDARPIINPHPQLVDDAKRFLEERQ